MLGSRRVIETRLRPQGPPRDTHLRTLGTHHLPSPPIINRRFPMSRTFFSNCTSGAAFLRNPRCLNRTRVVHSRRAPGTPDKTKTLYSGVRRADFGETLLH